MTTVCQGCCLKRNVIFPGLSRQVRTGEIICCSIHFRLTDSDPPLFYEKSTTKYLYWLRDYLASLSLRRSPP